MTQICPLQTATPHKRKQPGAEKKNQSGIGGATKGSDGQIKIEENEQKTTKKK